MSEDSSEAGEQETFAEDVEEVESEVADEDDEHITAVAVAEDKSVLDDSALDDHTENAGDGDEVDTVRSHMTEEEATSTISPKTMATPDDEKQTTIGSSTKKGRPPSVAGLTIPFRTVKKAMKLDPDIPIVQNEAAIMTTVAAELFLRRLAKASFRTAKYRGRNTIRYEDVAEARTKSSSLAFLEPLLP